MLRLLFAVALAAWAQPSPRITAVPLPYEEISFRRDGLELTRLHYGARMDRPFLYPVRSAKGEELTRMGHPHDPHGHRHHYSIWMAATPVNGYDYWGDDKGKIRTRRVAKLTDGEREASATLELAWVHPDGTTTLEETRVISVIDLGGDWMATFDSTIQARAPVEFAAKGFGPVGVRMAKWIGMNDGGGRLLNSEGVTGDKAMFRKPARWVDYSRGAGITLLDHPGNPQHPQAMHVRSDGWMGAVLTEKGAVTVRPGQPLRLRYGFFIHAAEAGTEAIEAEWKRFANR